MCHTSNNVSHATLHTHSTLYNYPVPDPDPEITGGGGGRSPKNTFRPFGPHLGLKTSGGPSPGSATDYAPEEGGRELLTLLDFPARKASSQTNISLEAFI